MNNKDKIILAIVISVVLFGLGVGVGTKLSTPKVQVQEKVVEKVVQKSVVDEKLIEKEVQKRVHDIELSMNKHVTKVVITKKDGTKVEKETVDTHTIKTEKTVEVKYVDRVVTVEKKITVTEEKVVEKTIKPVLPDWQASVLVGIQPSLFPPNVMPMTFGLEVDRRILGPLWVGGWAMVDANPLTYDFKDVKVGLKLTMEF